MKLEFALAILLLTSVTGCHKDSPAKKIVDGLPVSTPSAQVAPAQATQQYLLLKAAALNPVITNLNRLSLNLPPSGLTDPDGSSHYTFQRSESHYGTATFTIQFRDINNNPIDPFTVAHTSVSVKSVNIQVSNTSDSFSGSEVLTLTLATVGTLTGPFTMTGSSTFNGSSYSIVFTLDPAGVTATITGLLSGHATSTGTGPNSSPTSSNLIFGLENDLSGNLTWEGQSAGIYISADGSGFLTTSDSRILFQ